jgi:hypothetical protein
MGMEGHDQTDPCPLAYQINVTLLSLSFINLRIGTVAYLLVSLPLVNVNPYPRDESIQCVYKHQSICAPKLNARICI